LAGRLFGRQALRPGGGGDASSFGRVVTVQSGEHALAELKEVPPRPLHCDLGAYKAYAMA
jgi:hypothetical protein